MAELERTYTVPLRKGWLAAPMYRRAKRAMHELQNFVKKHMKAKEVLVGPELNMKIWEHGIRNPPHHVKVTAVKNDEGVCRVELFGHKFKAPKKDEKAEKKAGKGAKELAEKLKEKLTEKEGKNSNSAEKKEEKESASEKEKKTPANPAKKEEAKS
ncbi:60S ribosomal protein L31 [Candidatus Woesearchaeota archaeon]|nr:60S ribosomal protein L31 [Candidatus Woesearchaeota archaeon]